jgi:hypothetical protein
VGIGLVGAATIILSQMCFFTVATTGIAVHVSHSGRVEVAGQS